VYTIVIMLPGITGSTLVSQGDSFDDTTNPVWQTQVYDALYNNPTDQQALTLLEGNLFAGIPVATPAVQAYAQFAAFFAGLGFQTVNAATPQQPLPPAIYSSLASNGGAGRPASSKRVHWGSLAHA
jgi:hypothetical protein